MLPQPRTGPLKRAKKKKKKKRKGPIHPPGPKALG
jgi:hypothetical protein